MKATQEQFEQAVEILRQCWGKSAGITINALAQAVGLTTNRYDMRKMEYIPDRRACEQMLSTRLKDIPFCVCSTPSDGYYRPLDADQANACILSLRGRHTTLHEREQTVITKLREEHRIYYDKDQKVFLREFPRSLLN